MLVALLTDTHIGWRNDSLVFDDYFKRFFNEVFFPTLEERRIKTVVHLGDLFDRRKYINFHILHRCRMDILNPLEAMGITMHVIVGNHDIYWRNSNDVNSVTELCQSYPNLKIYEEPEEITLGSLRILLLPWMNPMNTAPTLSIAKASKAPVVMGHLEIAGFNYDRSVVCEHGLDRKLFKKFKKVFSGHFHTQSMDGGIHFLGSPYEMTFADTGDPRGFHIFDTETLELEFIPNPNRMFHKIVYDDRDSATHMVMLSQDFNHLEKTQVKINVAHKTDPYLYDRWLSRIEGVNPDTLQIIESFSLGVDEEVDDQFGDFEKGEVVLTDTLQVLNSYVDAMTIDLDKNRMREIMKMLYLTATKVN